MSAAEKFTSDQQLVEGCRAGNNAAWRELIHRYRPSLVRWLRKKLRDTPDGRNLAEELAQQTFEALLEQHCRRLWLYDPLRASLDSYLHVLAGQELAHWRRLDRQLRHQAVRLTRTGRPTAPWPIASKTCCWMMRCQS